MRWITEKLSFANVMAAIAVFMVLGGGAYAASGEIDGGDIQNNSVGGKDIRQGSVAGGDIKNNSLTGNDINESTLELPAASGGAQGPKGDAGPKGDKGEQGATGATGTPGTPATRLFAFVDSAGNLLAGNNAGVASAGRTGTGTYTVTFTRSINNCIPFLQVNGGGDTRISFSTPSPNDPASAVISVTTQDGAGTATDLPFNVAVFC